MNRFAPKVGEIKLPSDNAMGHRMRTTTYKQDALPCTDRPCTYANRINEVFSNTGEMGVKRAENSDRSSALIGKIFWNLCKNGFTCRHERMKGLKDHDFKQQRDKCFV